MNFFHSGFYSAVHNFTHSEFNSTTIDSSSVKILNVRKAASQGISGLQFRLVKVLSLT